MNLDKIVIKSNYNIRYDLNKFCKITSRGLLFPNFKLILRRVACGDPNPKKKEYTYFRIIENNDEKCIQFIIFYQWQYFPPHKHDYHPFFIYLDKNSDVNHMIYDKGHHRGKKILPTSKPLIFSIFLPDHHFETKFKSMILTRPLKCSYKALKPRQILYFWKINSMAQLKLRTKLIDPWDPGIHYTFRDEVKCPSCGNLHLLDFMNLKKNKLFLEIECKNHRFKAEYDIIGQTFITKKL